MTPKQTAILAYIQVCQDAGEPPPTVREIMDAVGLSSTSVANYELDALVSAGHIRRERGTSRGIRLAGKQEPGQVGKLAEVVKITTQLAEVVQVNQTQIADLQAEVERLGYILSKIEGRIVEGLG